MDDFQTYYEILELAESGTQADIKAAWRRLVKEYHTDGIPSERTKLREEITGKLQQVNEAYETLKKPDKRRQYDEQLKERRRRAAGAPGATHSPPPAAGTPPPPPPPPPSSQAPSGFTGSGMGPTPRSQPRSHAPPSAAVISQSFKQFRNLLVTVGAVIAVFVLVPFGFWIVMGLLGANLRSTGGNPAPVAQTVVEITNELSRKVAVSGVGGLIVRTVPSGASAYIEWPIYGTSRTIASLPGPEHLGAEQVQRTSPAIFTNVLTGKRTLKIELQGYDQVTREVEIKANSTIELGLIRMTRAVGDGAVITIPSTRVSLEARILNPAFKDSSSVEIFVDGAKAGASRSSADNSAFFVIPNVLVGRRSVEIRHPDYEAWSGSVVLSNANARPLEVQLVPKQATLTVEVTPQVSYALYLDGTSVSGRAGQFSLPAERELVLEVRVKDYEVATRRLRLPANGREAWQVTLTPVRLSLSGKIQNAGLKNASSLSIMVDGLKAEATLSSTEGSTLFVITNVPVGKRILEITHPDYETWKNFATVSDGSTRPLEIQFVPKPGMLRVGVSSGVDHALYLNGRQVAATNGQFTLPAERDLALQVRAKDYETAVRSLRLPANGSDVWQITLSPGPRMILDAATKQINPSGYVVLDGKKYLTFGLLGIGKRVAEGETIPIQFQGAQYDIEVPSINAPRSFQLRYKGQSRTVQMRTGVGLSVQPRGSGTGSATSPSQGDGWIRTGPNGASKR